MSQSFTRYLQLLAVICLTLVCTTRSEAISLSTNDLTHSMGNSNSSAGVLTAEGLHSATLGAWRSAMPDSRFAGITITGTVTEVPCYGSNTGRIITSVSGGTSPYTYLWSNGATTANLLNVVANNYTLLVTDASKATASKTFSVTQPTEIIAFINCTPVCYGTCNGTASITASGGTAPYTYSWSGPNFSAGNVASLSGLCVGTYWATVKDANGCIKIVGDAVCANPQIVITNTISNATCYGQCNGSITVSPAYKMNTGTCTGSPACPFSYAWAGGQTSASISGLCANTYYVTVTDCKGCTAADTIKITQPNPLGLTTSNTPVSCYGGSNGGACVTVSGGTAPYTYTWDGQVGILVSISSQTTNCITGQAAGIFSIKVTDANGCSATANDTIKQPTPLSIGIDRNVTCLKIYDGTATVTASASGGTSPYTYSWSGPGGYATTGATATIDSSGYNYYVTVTDQNGCTKADTVEIPTCTCPVGILTITGPRTVCNAGGPVTLTANSTAPAIGYLWNTGSTTDTIQPSRTGIYSVTVFFGPTPDCNATKSDTLVLDSLFAYPTITNTTCYAACNGSITVTPSSGAAPYTISWGTDGVSGFTPSGLCSGQYCFTVTDVNHCSTTGCATVGRPDSLTVIVNERDATCYNACNGLVNLTVSGGTPYTVGAPYHISWNQTLSGNGSDAVCAGRYCYTVSDTNGCSKTGCVTVGQPTQLVVAHDSSNVTCYNACNGTVSVTASGGTPNYTITWSDNTNVSSFSRSGLCAGQYCYTVNDANNCSKSGCINVTQPTLLVVTYDSTNVTCYGACNGSASVSASGGTPNYTINWADNSDNHSFSRQALCAGQYCYTVHDANGCSKNGCITINQPTQLKVTQDSTNVTCYGACNGTVSISPSGGTSPYTVSWAGIEGNGLDQEQLCAGTYCYTVTDANKCSVNGCITVNHPDSLTVTPRHANVTCYGACNGTASVSVSGGTPNYTITWADNADNHSYSRTGLCNGLYCYTINDANNCSKNGCIEIAQPTKLTATTSHTNVSCYGGDNGTASVSASGGTPNYTYSWSTGATGVTSISGLTYGIYGATVTDANGCSVTVADTITQPTKLTATTSHTNVSCYGGDNGTASVTPSGGTTTYTYSWNTGSSGSVISGLSAGIYGATVTDANGCSVTVADTITQPTKLTATTSHTNVSCYGGDNGTASLSASGGTPNYTYSWSTGATGTTSISGLSIGIYGATVTDANGCSVTVADTITQPTQLTATTSHTNVSCYGGDNGSASVSASGGTLNYTYSWSTGTTGVTSISGLTYGIYGATVTDANGCSVTVADTITQPTKLTATTSHTNVSCYGGDNGSASVSASGGTPNYTYSWSTGATGTTSISGLSIGIYGATVTDANGCSVTVADTITQPTKLTATTSHTNVSCYGGDNGTASLSASGGTPNYTYSWSTGATGTTSISGLSIGIYGATVTDANGCSVTVADTITQPTKLTATTSHTNVSCYGGDNGSASVSASGGTLNYTYSWSTGATGVTSISGLTYGIYGATVTDANGCSVTVADTITQPTQLTITTDSTNATCYGSCNGTASVSVSGGTPNYTINWADNSDNRSFSREGLCSGKYCFTVHDANGCSKNGCITISQADSLKITQDSTNATCYNECNGIVSIKVTGGTRPYTIKWAHDASINGFDLEQLCAGTYCYTVTDVNKCSKSGCITVNQPDSLSTTPSNTNVTCYGSCNGSASVSVSGGTPNYTITWDDGTADLFSRQALCAGQYCYTVYDANNCSRSGCITITQGDSLTITTDSTNVTCYNACNGTASVSVSGGTPGYTITWSDGAGDVFGREALCAGTYCYTVHDANGCSKNGCITVNQPTALVVTQDSTNVTCYNSCNGTASVSVSGGTPDYTITWSDGAGDVFGREALCAGTYCYTVHDANGCTKNGCITINQPDSLTIVTYPSNPSCYNSCDGNALVVVTGGTAAAGEIPYTIVWDSSDVVGFAPTNLCGGTYCFTVTDGNNCSKSACVTIVPPDTLKAPYTSTQPTCYNSCNGTITVSPTGGTTNGDGAQYNIIWNHPYLNGTFAVTGLCGDSTYCFTVSDQNGCSKTGCVTITHPDSLTVDTSHTDLTCNEINGPCDGTITVNVSGGTAPYTITWSDNLYGATGGYQNNLCPDTYCYTVTDANGCSKSGCLTINQPPMLLISSNCCPDQITCHNACNGKITVNVFGGVAPYTYAWSGPAGFVSIDTDYINNLCAGTYTVTVTDKNGCSYDETHAPLTNPDTLISGLTFKRPTNCATGLCNGTVSVSPSGGTIPYTITWSNGETGVTSIGSLCGDSTYTVTIVDAVGCSIVDGIALPGCSCPILAIDTTHSEVTCYGASNATATITPSNGQAPYTITWVNTNISGFTPSGLAAGTYCFTIKDANGCPGSACITITQPDSLSLTKATVNSGICKCNGSASVSVSGGTSPYTYSWSGPSVNSDNVHSSSITGICADGSGFYCVTVTDANGCSKAICMAVTHLDPPVITLIVDTTNVSCYGACNGGATVTPSGGFAPYTISWNKENVTGFTPSGLCPGNYCFTVTDANGCYSVNRCVAISQPDSLHVTHSTTNASCSGLCDGKATITATGGTYPYTIVWDSSKVTGFTPTNLCGGTYCYTVSDANRCTRSGCVTITQTTLTVTVHSTDGTCSSTCGYAGCTGTITLNITGVNVYTVNWTGTGGFCSHSTSLTKLCSGQYCYTVTAGSCTETGCVTISQPTPVVIAVCGTNNTCGATCTGTATVTVSSGDAPFTYTWNNGGKTAKITALCAGTYTVTVTSSTGCTASASVCITKPSSFTISVCTQNATCNGNCNGTASVSVSGGNSPFTYSWSGPSGYKSTNKSAVTCLCPGQYCVTVTSGSGCTASQCVTITQPNPISVTVTGTNISCNGSNNGAASATVTGGTGPFSYHWNNGSCASSICNLCAGCYCVTVTSCGGCSASACVTITAPKPLCATVTTSNATCSGGCNGTASASATGGTGTYTYKWNNGSKASSISGLCPGSYCVTVTSGACSVTKTFTICGPSSSIKVCLSGTNPTKGNNGEACVTSVSGGTSPYTFAWSCNKTTCCITSLGTGTYCVTVYDANRCSATACVTLSTSNCGARTDDGSQQPADVVAEPQINVYPNPFTTYTNIDFVLPNDDNVTLEVYSITGVKVAELYKGAVKGGIKNSVRFTTENLSEAMYIYRLSTTDKAMTGNLIIVR